MKIDLDEKTAYFLNVAMCSNNYSTYLNIPDTKFAEILGLLYRKYQDHLRKVSPQGVSLLIAYLTSKSEKDYEEYIKILKDKVDNIIQNNSTIKDQLEELSKYNQKK